MQRPQSQVTPAGVAGSQQVDAGGLPSSTSPKNDTTFGTAFNATVPCPVSGNVLKIRCAPAAHCLSTNCSVALSNTKVSVSPCATNSGTPRGVAPGVFSASMVAHGSV